MSVIVAARTCAHCSVPMDGMRSHAQHCSRRCAAAARAARRGPRVLACERCEAPFVQERRAGRPRRLCAGCFGTPAGDTKVCGTCGEAKSVDEFYAMAGASDGLRPDCKLCDKASALAWHELNPRAPAQKAEYNRHWYAANRERLRDYDLQRKYGITQADYDDLLAEQGGKCAICASADAGGKGRFHVDHDHETDAVRGLLCHLCNTGLGLFADDAARLSAAIDYLEVNR